MEPAVQFWRVKKTSTYLTKMFSIAYFKLKTRILTKSGRAPQGNAEVCGGNVKALQK